MYFRQGGGTCSVVVRVPGVVTWARFSYRNHKMYLCAGRGVTDVPTDDAMERDGRRTATPNGRIGTSSSAAGSNGRSTPTIRSPYWATHLADLKAFALELGLPFECYDYRTPGEIEKGAGL